MYHWVTLHGAGAYLHLQSYLVNDVTKVYYLVSLLAEDTYIPPTGVTQYNLTPVKTSIL